MILSSPLLIILSTIINCSPIRDQLVQAIWEVETNQCLADCPEGADGEIGPLQITKGAFSDVMRDGEHYEMCQELDFSVIVFNRYMDRYATPARVGKVTNEIKARIWNGGPRGHLKDSTKKYWNLVNQVLHSQLPQ